MHTSSSIPVRAAAVYCRISSDPTGDRLGVTRQRDDCYRLADQCGWPVHDVYVDNDISAYRATRRPDYERLLADITSGTVDAIITWHLDRLNRSPLELERLINLLDTHRVRIQTVTAGVLDLATPSGRAVARTLGAWARFESEHKSERIRARKHQNALQGAPNSGGTHRPYGYAADRLAIIPAEAAVIRQAMRRFLAGTPTAVICRDLNTRGLRTTGGRPWLSSNLDQILTSPRIAGWRQTPQPFPSRAPREFLARAQWPPIVSRRAVEHAQQLIADPTRRPGSPYRRLLTGIATCGLCHQPLRLVTYQAKTVRYSCQPGSTGASTRCGHVSILADFLDNHVLGQVSRHIADGRLLDVTGAAAHAGKGQSAACQPAASELSRGSVRAAFSAASASQQRQWIQTLSTAITVAPASRRGGRLDPNRIEIIWRAPRLV